MCDIGPAWVARASRVLAIASRNRGLLVVKLPTSITRNASSLRRQSKELFRRDAENQHTRRVRYPDRPRLVLKQIRTILAGTFHRLFFSPLRDLGVIAGKKNIWNFPTVEFSRTRVLRRFEITAAKAVIHG